MIAAAQDGHNAQNFEAGLQEHGRRATEVSVGLIALALFVTSNLYFNAVAFGRGTAAVLAVIALSMWFIALPMIFTLIDLKHNPERLEKFWTK